MLSIAVDSTTSIIWNVTPITSTMTNKAELIGGTMMLGCFISVEIFTILLEITELKVDNSPLQKVFFKGV